MKVQRYQYGKTNLRELASQKANLVSPETMAAAAAAPYDAVAQVAGQVSSDLDKLNQQKIQKEAKQDAMYSALNVSNYKTQFDQLGEQAIKENWSQDQYEQNVDALNKTLLDSANIISDRNREEVLNAYSLTAAQGKTSAALISQNIKDNNIITDSNAQRLDAVNNKQWERVAFLDEMSFKAGYLTPEEYDERKQGLDEFLTIENLTNEYESVYSDKGARAKLLADLPGRNLSPETERAFLQNASTYDRTQKAQEDIIAKQQQEVQDRALVDIGQTIKFTPIKTEDDLLNYATAFSDENLHKIADDMDLSLANREKLFNTRNKRMKQIASRGDTEQGGVIEPDLTSKTYRDDISNTVASELGINPETATTAQGQEIIDAEIMLAPEKRAMGTNLTNWLNNSASGSATTSETEGWSQLLSALPVFEQMQGIDGLRWDGVDQKNIEMMETLRHLNYQQNPDLARKVWVNYNSASQQELDRAREQFDMTLLDEALIQDEDVADRAGLVRADAWLWMNKEPNLNGPVQALKYDIGKAMSIHEALTMGQINYNSLADKVANVLGTMVNTSTLNKGTPSGLDGIGMISAEAFAHAPVEQEGEIWARDVLTQDFNGVDGSKTTKVKVFNEVYTVGDPVDPKAYDESRMDMSDPYDAPMAQTIPDPFGDIEGNVIPVNWIQVRTPGLRQDQFDMKGRRIWHLYYRGKPLLKEDDTMIEWSPHFDDNDNPRVMQDATE